MTSRSYMTEDALDQRFNILHGVTIAGSCGAELDDLFGDDPTDDMETIAEVQAFEQGVYDFQHGVHLNPCDHETEGDEFRAWIVGYNHAKAAA